MTLISYATLGMLVAQLVEVSNRIVMPQIDTFTFFLEMNPMECNKCLIISVEFGAVKKKLQHIFHNFLNGPVLISSF